METPGLGEAGQLRLAAATVLISRAGGLGGMVALQLAAAGIGRLVIAHGGTVLPGDLNRQLLQTHADIGQPRIPGIERRLRALNPRIELTLIAENASETNATSLVATADVVVDAAPLFEERYALNAASVAQRKPMIEAAVYALEGQLTTFLPGKTPCLRCLHPQPPPDWKRRFPVLGAVSGTLGCLAAIEVIKVVTGMGRLLANELLSLDAGSMLFRKFRVVRDPDCPVCGSLPCG